jgi:hypothetical protein
MDHFKQLLAEHHDWPCQYLFKFVVPSEHEGQVRALIPDAEITVRQSKNGRFVSVSIKAEIDSPEDVIEIHTRASLIEGLIAL